MVLVAPRPKDFDKSRKWLLKLQQPDVYPDKFLIECYNFIHQYQDYFIISNADSNNRVPFAIGYLKDLDMNRWQ